MPAAFAEVAEDMVGVVEGNAGARVPLAQPTIAMQISNRVNMGLNSIVLNRGRCVRQPI